MSRSLSRNCSPTIHPNRLDGIVVVCPPSLAGLYMCAWLLPAPIVASQNEGSYTRTRHKMARGVFQSSMDLVARACVVPPGCALE